MNLNVLCNSDEQLYAALSNEQVDEIIVEADSTDRAAARLCHEQGKRAGIALPYIFRDVTYVSVDGFDEVYVRSLDELAYYRGRCLVSDYGLYSMNQAAADWLRDNGITRVTAPVELNEHELRELNLRDKELIVYGHIPMMVSAQCIHKNTAGCDKRPGFTAITDRTGKTLMAENKCAYCCNLIYNANPLSLAGVWNKVQKLNPASVRVNLTIEGEEEAADIIKIFAGALAGRSVDDPPTDYTRGHFTRGVE